MAARDPPRPLDESLYELKPEEYELLSSHTGIKDAEELKQHVLAVQREIYQVCGLEPPTKLRMLNYA